MTREEIDRFCTEYGIIADCNYKECDDEDLEEEDIDLCLVPMKK
jgi:hypothetical protein